MAMPEQALPRDPVHHPVFSRFYARMSVVADTRGGFAELRSELLSGLSGRVIEIGAGNGLNFARYPRTVCEVVAVEPDRTLRKLAREAAQRCSVPVDVVPGAAEALPVKSESFDGAVACLVLCSVRDLRRSLTEIRRVLRPGAELRFLEHGRAPGRTMSTVQSLLDRSTVWPRLCGGCHTSREPISAIEEAGLVVTRARSLRVPPQGPALPTSFCELGRALVPEED
ncbi:class I SAM-dependent methyltransferase [Streptomyces sp. NPDC006879]|uniref:class I SAM-dependent methyltransferase n=1 Tax=Streptomyces sp. NPDC006879 TaxID=3364767 RepID=UPI0036A37292